jgi:hypothetical protein
LLTELGNPQHLTSVDVERTAHGLHALEIAH